MNTFSNCVWVGADKDCVSPIISRRFKISNAKKATLYITGLGYFDAQINDASVTDYWFLPVASDYEPRDFSKFTYPLNDTTTNRIYYYDFDITSLLKSGENTLSIQLGNGFYRQNERTAEGDTSYGDILKCIYKIVVETDDGIDELCSDGSESYTNSFITYNNLFYGETVDYTARISNPKKVSILPTPKSKLCKAIGTPDKIIRTIIPTKIGEKNGKVIFDAGENISGVVSIKTTAASGSAITLRFAENIRDNLDLNFDSVFCGYQASIGKPQIMSDTFITDGKTRTFMPKFVWHAFRYFEVEGNFDELQVFVIHSDTHVTSSFESNHEGMNFLYDAFIRTQLDNMHGSFPSDCPHRERLGYTGDGQIAAPAVLMTLDAKEFYIKWIQDILDCQDKNTGHVQHTAPFMGGGGGPGGWGSAIINVPYAFYKQYGDTSVLKKCYDAMKKWIEYLVSRSENGLLVREECGGWCLGDWSSLEEMAIPEAYVNSCYFVKNLIYLEEIAAVIDSGKDIPYFKSLRATTEKAIVDKYYDHNADCFAGGIQGSDAFAVWCGLASRDTAQKLAQKYSALRHFDTGFLGTDILCEVLFKYGFGDTVLDLLASEDKGSYLYMKRHGATTIWENWNGGSHCHPMFGAPTRQLFESVLGITQRNGTAGYCDVIISPIKTKTKLQASGSINTPNGIISVSIDTTGEEPKLSVNAPDNIKVEIKNNM